MANLKDSYSVTQAVDDGVLLDVSDLGANARLPYPVYVTSGFFNSVEINGSKFRVQATLDDSYLLRRDIEQKNFGTRIYNVSPRLLPWGVSYRATLKPSEKFGAVIFITEREGEILDFSIPRTSAGGSFYVV